jgi:hypothetical protein
LTATLFLTAPHPPTRRHQRTRDPRNLQRGKITWQQLQAVLGAVANNLAQEIMENDRNVILCIDIMFVNRIPFFLTISKKLHFITAEVLDNRKEESLVKALKRVYGVYRKRGFRINNILADAKFQCTRRAVATDLRSELNICGENEHIPDIERCIRTTIKKEPAVPITLHPLNTTLRA